jgi:hypothetical protein
VSCEVFFFFRFRDFCLFFFSYFFNSSFFEKPPIPYTAVALLQEKVGLQTAMLLVPFCYAGSGVAFFFAEKVLAAEKAEAREAAAKQERRELKKVRKEGAAAAAIVAGRKEG